MPVISGFTLNKKETDKYEDWEARHYKKDVCSFFDDGSSHSNPVGAIGGRLTWCFTPTGIGVITVIECACGAKVNITDFDNW